MNEIKQNIQLSKKIIENIDIEEQSFQENINKNINNNQSNNNNNQENNKKEFILNQMKLLLNSIPKNL